MLNFKQERFQYVKVLLFAHLIQGIGDFHSPGIILSLLIKMVDLIRVQIYNNHPNILLHQDLFIFLSFPKAYFFFKGPDFFFINQAKIHQ